MNVCVCLRVTPAGVGGVEVETLNGRLSGSLRGGPRIASKACQQSVWQDHVSRYRVV
jgi:hypothetical protein